MSTSTTHSTTTTNNAGFPPAPGETHPKTNCAVDTEREQLESFDMEKLFALIDLGIVDVDDIHKASRFLTNQIATYLWKICTPAAKSVLLCCVYREVKALCVRKSET